MSSTQSLALSIVIVEKNGDLKSLTVKDFKEEELFKKCGFKKAEDFVRQTEWKLKTKTGKYLVTLYGKTEGRANSENKYDFPPPVDMKLFFGSCALTAKIGNSEGQWEYTHLTLEMWEQFYEKLFGGFEDLATTAKEDEEEEDELANVPKEKKTKDGYLKDGFVVDSSDSYEEEEDDSGEEEASEELEDSEEFELEEVGSELSEEEYDYDSTFEKG
jgi:hypothetical protein